MIEQLKETAQKYRILYNRGEVSREEAKEHIMPYINAYNEKAVEVAKKYGLKPKKISFGSYIR